LVEEKRKIIKRYLIMAFIIDKQTINDLKIFGKVRGNSIYSLFNVTKTMGGSKILEEMFRYPLSEEDKINQRTDIIKYFISKDVKFNFLSEWFDQIEHYLSDTDERSRLDPFGDSFRRKFKELVGAEVSYKQIHKGVVASCNLVKALDDFVKNFDAKAIKLDEISILKDLLQSDTFSWALRIDDTKK
jgi:Mismatch repair ATPase (MutS family)